jgi:hypothetical protein
LWGERTIDRRRSVSELARVDMGVGVHRQGVRGVTKRFHDDPRCHTLCEKEAGCSVSTVVEAMMRNACPFQQQGELP